MKTWLVDAMLETEEQKQRRERRKANRKHKLAVDAIKEWLVCGNVRTAIDIAEANEIDAKEFGRIARTV